MLNPFHNRMVGSPWERPEGDVADIGKAAFSACLQAIERTLEVRRTTAVLLRGEPGSGKTHAIRRLRAHLEQSADIRLRGTLFVYMRLATTGKMLWRHLRRRIADELLRQPAEGITQLERLMYRILARPGSRGGLLDQWKREIPNGVPWNEHRFANALAAALRIITESELAVTTVYQVLEGDDRLPPSLAKVLHRLVHRQDLGLVRAWLRGDALTATDLERLGVPEDDREEEPEDAARELIFALIRLAGARMPMVLCFDQIEALATAPNDPSGFLAFGSAASMLHDETDNLVLITCAQSALADVFRRADYERIAEQQVHLPLLGKGDAQRLIAARLTAAQPGAVWTPPEAEWDRLFSAQGQASARAVLAKAAELYEQTISPSATPEVPLGAFLERDWEIRVEDAAEAIAQASDIDEVLSPGIHSLFTTAPGSWIVRDGHGDVDIRVESPSRRFDVSLCNQRNTNSLAGKLRRLGKAQAAGLTHGPVLLRDSRLSISPHARATRRYLSDLTKAGARLVRPSIEALQALEALRTLLADARSGDLTRNGSPIAAQTVQEWLAGNMPASLNELMRDITGTMPADDGAGLSEDLRAVLEQRCILTIDEAARAIHQDINCVRQLVKRSPGLAGVLEGPPMLLYRPVPGVSA